MVRTPQQRYSFIVLRCATSATRIEIPSKERPMEDRTVAADEARRVAQHEATSSNVEEDVNADVAERADHGNADDTARIDSVASEMRSSAIDDVAGRNREVSRARGTARISQVVDYLFFVVYGLLAIRLVLALIAANASNGFVRFINTVTDPFYALFRGIVGSPAAEGGYVLAVPIIIAIAVYALLHAAINGFLRMIVHRKTAV
jgi:uncharacterized protein YggT (Ycf19 family)